MTGDESDAETYRPLPFTFPSPECIGCSSAVLDPDKGYCETCLNALGISMAEEWGDL